MNMDMLSRGFDILQRAGGMEQISQLMVIVYGSALRFRAFELYPGISYPPVLDDDLWIYHRSRRRLWCNLYVRCSG